MNPETNPVNADEQSVRSAIAALASRGCFSNPAGPEAITKILDDVAYDLPGFADVSEWMVPILQEHGWKDEEVSLLVSGIDMALMIVHEVTATK